MAQSTNARQQRSDAGQAKSDMRDKVFRDFGTMNTQAARQAISESEFAWAENVMPVGPGNCFVVPGPSTPLCTVTNGTVYYIRQFNRAGSNFMFMVTTTGHAYECALDGPFTFREITNPITPEFGPSEVTIDQWKNERIVIVDPVKGFFDWDGTTLTPPGSLFSITITTGGIYTSIPTISFSGGGGSGAAATAVLGINGTQTITAAGAGYLVGDVLTLVGGTFTSPGKVKVTTVGGGGAVTAVAVFDPGAYSALLTPPAAVTGGAGSGCTITPSYAVFSATVTGKGSGYTSAPAIAFSAGVATATANLVGAPTGAKRVASFSGRVWVAAGRLLAWTAPNTYNDFLGPGSGSLIISDSTLDSYISFLESANNYLYVGGVDSVNVIGDVQVDSLGNTVFSNTNLNASVGTLATLTVIAYFRQLLFMNVSGAYSISGATPTKISDPMDGIVQGTDFHGIVSAGTFVLNNILCAAFLVLYNPSGGPSTASNSRPLMMIHFNKKWFVANQDGTGTRITIIAGGKKNDSVNAQFARQNLYATDGANLFQIFADDSVEVSWKLQTAFWDMGAVGRGKEVNALMVDATGLGGTINATIDMIQKEKPFTSSYPVTITLDDSIDWDNALGNALPWQNQFGNTTLWADPAYAMFMGEAEGFGKYVGVTLTSDDFTGQLGCVALRYTFREDW